MTNLTSSDLSDPQPPVPGERERARVAERAHELGRRRRLVQGGGALALVAAVAVSVAALTAGGSSGPGGTNRVEAASASADTTDAPTTQATTPTTVVATTVPAPAPAPAPAPDTAPAADAQTTPAVEQPDNVAPVAAAAPSTFSVSGTITGNPAGTTVSITFNGDGGQFTATADGAGNYSVSGLPAGDYLVVGQWVATTDDATAAQKFGTVSISGDSTASFSFSN